MEQARNHIPVIQCLAQVNLNKTAMVITHTEVSKLSPCVVCKNTKVTTFPSSVSFRNGVKGRGKINQPNNEGGGVGQIHVSISCVC